MLTGNGLAMVLEIMVAVGTVIGFAVVSVKWLVKNYFEEIKGELKHNGGSSIKDQVTRLEKDVSILKDHMIREEREQDDLRKKLDNMYNILLDYVSNKK